MLCFSRCGCRQYIIGAMLIITQVLSATPVFGQILKGTLRYADLNSTNVDSLLNRLRKDDPGDFASIQRYFFDTIQGGLYDRNLADLIVFSSCDSDTNEGRNMIVLTENGDPDQHLWGKRNVYVLLFYEHRLPKGEAKTSTGEERAMNNIRCDSEYKECLEDALSRIDSLGGLAKIDQGLLYTRLRSECLWQWEKCVAETKTGAALKRWSPESGKLTFPLADSGRLNVDLDFVELKKSDKSGNFPPEEIPVRLSPLDYRPGRSQSLVESVVGAVGSIFGLAGIKAPPSDTSLQARDTVKLQKLGVDSNKKIALYFGIGKLPLRENSVNRVSIEIPDSNTVAQATFGNYDGSRFGVSLAIGVTKVKGVTDILGVQSTKLHTEVFTDTVVTLNGSGSTDTTIKTITRDSVTSSVITEEDYPFETYVIGHYYFRRPTQPYYRVKGHSRCSRIAPLTWGIFAGTRISTDAFLDDFVFGISGTGMIVKQQKIGVLLGVNL